MSIEMTDQEREERDRVIEIAKTWIGTPYHDNAGVKGGGVDCAWLLKEVFEEAKLTAPIHIPSYSPQFMLHRDEERYLAEVFRHAKEIDEAQTKYADVVFYKFGRVFSHGAIIMPTGWPNIIHAHGGSNCVVTANGMDGRLGGNRQRRFFTRW